MLPLCLVVGDSIAVGTAEALVADGLRCAVHAQVGASSGDTLRTLDRTAPAERALIALGSNDPRNPLLMRNLVALRQRIAAVRVTWLTAYDRGAAAVTTAVARAFGDEVVQLGVHASNDGIHPASYRRIARSLGWWRVETVRAAPAPSPPVLPPPPAVRPVRQATVVVF